MSKCIFQYRWSRGRQGRGGQARGGHGRGMKRREVEEMEGRRGVERRSLWGMSDRDREGKGCSQQSVV